MTPYLTASSRSLATHLPPQLRQNINIHIKRSIYKLTKTETQVIIISQTPKYVLHKSLIIFYSNQIEIQNEIEI